MDGYNIIHQIPKLTHLEIDQQRLILVREIENFRPQGSHNNRVTLYFDGRPGRAAPIQSTAVHVIFTLDVSADDRIKSAVREAGNSRNIIVVTDDRDIQYSVRACGAKILKVKDFLKKLKSISQKTESPGPSKTIDSSVKDKINEELKSLWLKKKKPK